MPSYDINQYRSLFPFLETGKRYFNHASTSPLSTRVVAAMQNYLREKSIGDLEIIDRVVKQIVELKSGIATLLRSSKDRIALLDNTSNGLNIIANGLSWKHGDRILIPDVEFPANVYPFLNLRRFGVEIDFLKTKSGAIHAEDVDRALTSRTRLLTLSHVQFLHGFRADLQSIGEVCRRNGVVFCVDAIQSAGIVPIDVEKMKIDFLASGAQKWLMAPEGISFIYVSEECQSRIQQAYMGWMNMKDFFSDFFRYRVELEQSARRYENGTPNVAGIAGFNASLALLMEVGVEKIEAHLRDLTHTITDHVSASGFELLSPATEEHRAGIVTFRPPNAKELFERLRSQQILVSLREDAIRFSPHFYNTVEDLQTALRYLR